MSGYTVEQALAALKDSKATIQTGGWWNGQGTEERPGMACIALACPEAMWAHVDEILGFEDLPSAYRWNDEPGRTEEQVLAYLDRRIAYYEGMR